MITQPGKVVPPLPSDPRLFGYSQIIQSALDVLFQAGHVHKVVDTAPTSRTGAVGDIYLFDNGTNIYLYIKTGRGWARSASFTLI